MSDAPPQEETQKKSPLMLIVSIVLILGALILVGVLLYSFRESIFPTSGAPAEGSKGELKSSAAKSADQDSSRTDDTRNSLRSKVSLKDKSSMNLLQQGAEKELVSSGLGEKRRRSELKEMGQAKNDLLLNMGSIH